MLNKKWFLAPIKVLAPIMLLAIKITAILMLLFSISSATSKEKTVIRFGHFPNITHAQGVIAHALSRQGKGWFEKRLGPNVEIQWFTYNAGPSAMEAIFAGSLDVTYVGPSPALNAHFRSNGEEIRVISGAANAGAALAVKADSPIKTPEDFRGKKIDFFSAKVLWCFDGRISFYCQGSAGIGRA